MSETVMAERITITLSGPLLAYVENEAERACVTKEAIVSMALHEHYEGSKVDIGLLERILKP
jgi:hypothetical protein